ncbi:MAG: hypothetical protein NT154_25015, partial [Verrucomicrobia bacterium]|nr:hypothetical protein [Verrucomicrobiota bacterium]
FSFEPHMKSHQYAFGPRDLGHLLASLIVPLIVFAVLMRLGALSGVLPIPWPALDLEHTVLTHQALASQTHGNADILLIGDSSCLMNVSCSQLGELYGGKHQPVNLGTFMYLGFDGYATMLSRYAAVNSGRVRTVLVLAHPEMLRGVAPIPHYLRFVSTVYCGEDYGDADSILGQLRGLFGLDIFQSRLLSRMPLPLPKEYGRFYGFNLNLYKFMDRHDGSAVDPHQYQPAPGQGDAEYRLAAIMESGYKALRAAVPPEAKLVVGLSPIPQSFAPEDYPTRWHQLLRQWGQWMAADQVLTNLPATLPDSCFASTTHLNQQGAERYTRMVAQQLQPR